MKKFLIMFAMSIMTLTLAAQTATEDAKILDNTYVNVSLGVATPLALDNVFPLNTTATLAIGKQFTPVWGAEVEGTAWLGSHVTNGLRFDGVAHNMVRGIYVGVNGTTNLTNLLCDYKGSPRTFELSTVLGGGWIHSFSPIEGAPLTNDFGVKTGLDFAFNLGENKAHTINVRPAVLWDVVSPNGSMPLEFDKRQAQLQLSVGYTYHFATSNGTHAFKTYDVGALNARINELKAENEALRKVNPQPTVMTKAVTNIEEKVVEKKVEALVDRVTTIAFKQGSAELTDASLNTLKNLTATKVMVEGFASPEGGVKRNEELSLERATVVANVLCERGIEVTNVVGHGAVDDASQRIVIITAQ